MFLRGSMSTGEVLVIRWSPRSVGRSTVPIDSPSLRQVEFGQTDLEVSKERYSVPSFACVPHVRIKLPQAVVYDVNLSGMAE